MPVLSRARTIGGDGAFDIRDLGGYTTTSGQTVRDRTVYRADDLHRLPGADTTALDRLHLRTVLDLRTNDEVDAGGCTAGDVESFHLPILLQPA